MTTIFLAMFWSTMGSVAAATHDGMPQVVAVYRTFAIDPGMLVPAPKNALPDRGIYRHVAPGSGTRVIEIDVPEPPEPPTP